jgi:threonyl-tRNA synthetase
LQRIPYLLVVGDREMATDTVAVRTRTGQDLGDMSLAAFVERLQADIARRGRIE